MKKTKMLKGFVDKKVKDAEEIKKYLEAAGWTQLAEKAKYIALFLESVRDGKVEVVND